MSSIKTIIIPALLALALYLFATFFVLPLWRRHRQRYAQYLPVQHHSLDFENLSHSTTSLRRRVSDALASFLLPQALRDRFRLHQSGGVVVVDGSANSGESSPGAEPDLELEGETLAAVDARRRAALEERRRTLERRRRVDEQEFSDRRLSRELEEGFMDSSEDDDAGEVEGRGDMARTERWRHG